MAVTLHTYPQLRWDKKCLEDYNNYNAHLLGYECVTSYTNMCFAIDYLAGGDGAGATELMRDTLFSTAKLAGMKAKEL